ncbi:MAG: hypothetical protein R3244_10160, partial [Thermoanaerobaculia bacterium]|nr:hypothetical protein [Thermoanaerobaculia bacterium]
MAGQAEVAVAKVGAEGEGIEFPSGDDFFPEDIQDFDDLGDFDPDIRPPMIDERRQPGLGDEVEDDAEFDDGDEPDPEKKAAKPAKEVDGGDPPADKGGKAPDSTGVESGADRSADERWAKRFEEFERRTSERFEKMLKSQQETQARLLAKQLEAQGLIDGDVDVYDLLGMDKPKEPDPNERVSKLEAEIDAMRAQARHERIIAKIQGDFVPEGLGDRSDEFKPPPGVFLQGLSIGGDEVESMKTMGREYKMFVEKVANASREALLSELKEEGIDVDRLRGIIAERKAGKAPKGRGTKPSRKKKTNTKKGRAGRVHNDPLEEGYLEAIG